MTITVPRPQLGSGIELIESALTVPYAAGMRTDTIALTNGSFSVVTPRREPVLLVRLKQSLADEAIVILVEGQAPVVFAPFSAEGTLLPAFRPHIAEGDEVAGPFSVEVTVHRVTDESRLQARPDTGDALTQENAAGVVEAVVLEGRFARMLLLTTLEKQRCIRQMREIAALRHRRLAHTGGLDQRGRDLGVPRLAGEAETDEHFRARLAIYSKWHLATPAGFRNALNGPGADDDPNAGLPSLVGVKSRFTVVEQTNDLSVATKLVAVGPEGAAQRTRLHELLRSTYLVDIDKETSELVPSQRRAHYEGVRTTLRDELERPVGAGRPRFVAPLVATTLARSIRLMRALGHAGSIELLKAHDENAGSRYELGLGVDVRALEGGVLQQLADGVEQLAEQGRKDRTDELGQLAGSLQPRSPADDPLGAWLFEPCGFRTVHAIDSKITHLSPLPSFGQWIDGPADVARGATAVYESRYRSGGTAAGIHIRAQEAASDAKATFERAGLDPVPGFLDPTQLRTTLTALAGVAPAAIPDSLAVAAAAGIVSTDGKVFAQQLLDTFNLDQVVAFVVPKSALETLGAGEQLRDALVQRVDAFSEAGFYSVRGLWHEASSELLLLASVSQLPGASSKLGEPPPASFHWYETRLPKPLAGTGNPIVFSQRRGGRATVTAPVPGLSLLVCIGYARRGLADPFEVRIELDDPDALLNMDQYGYLMNLLEFLYPIGIEINTFDIRRRHVDADGDGSPEFLTSRASRTYHRYSHRRPFGSGRGRDQRGFPQ
jgi:hypothetical protein